MLTDLPRDVAEDVLSRLPVTSLRGVRSTCKKWNKLYKHPTFTMNNIRLAKKKQRKKFQVVMMLDYRLSLFNINLFSPPCIEPIGKLISLDDADRVDISNIFHCNGLLLCKTKDMSRLVVWNPCSGQTSWIEPRDSYHRGDRYALGHERNNLGTHKVLRFVDEYYGIRLPSVLEFEIYNSNSNSWKLLDVNPDWEIENFRRGLCLDGNTYWIAQDKKLVPVEGRPDKVYLPMYLLCFDFTTETFGPRLPLPFHSLPRDTVTLSSVRDKQLAVLYQKYTESTLKIWISSSIEPNGVLWNKLFLKVDMKPLTGFTFLYSAGSFFVDEKKKMALVLDKDRGILKSHYAPTRNIAYIIGKKGYFKTVDLGKSRHVNCWPLGCSYVPSSVQIYQPAQRGGDQKTS